MSLRFQRVSFRYPSAPADLFVDLSLQLDPGWTGVVGANGAGKSTLLDLAAGGLEPTRGRVARPAVVACCPQRTDAPPPALEALCLDWSAGACRWRGLLAVPEDAAWRWETLSHGERKRCQLAVALASEPDLLVVDEPTNHLDEPGRERLLRALVRFRGIGLLVSHDRALLDRLCARCLFLGGDEPTTRPGGWSAGQAQADHDRATAVRVRQRARQQLARAEAQALRAAGEASGSARRLSARGLARGDSDGRAKLRLARLTGKDARAGRARQLALGRVGRAREALEAARVAPERAVGVVLPGLVHRGAALIRAPAAELALGPERRLTVPELVVGETDRVALVGGNGSGKTTLLAHLVASHRQPEERVVVVPQHLDRAEGRRLLATLRELGPEARGRALTLVSHLGSDPGSLLDSSQPSPGEARKIALALAAARSTSLLVLDEPTNHFDLPAVRALEQALQGFPAALLLVSHDPAFREAVGAVSWRLEGGGVIRGP